jgi:hypothetical protein
LIYGLKQGSRSVSEFFTALKVLWEELEDSKPLINASDARKAEGRVRGINYGYSGSKKPHCVKMVTQWRLTT